MPERPIRPDDAQVMNVLLDHELRLEMRNETKAPIKYWPWGLYEDDALRVTHEDGRPVAYRGHTYNTRLVTLEIEPGRDVTVSEDWFSHRYDLSRPRRYRVQHVGPKTDRRARDPAAPRFPPPSNVIAFEVRDGRIVLPPADPHGTPATRSSDPGE